MPLSQGRNPVDPKVQRSLNIFPYSNLFAITGIIETNADTWKLFSPISNIQSLPRPQITTAQTVWVASTSNNDDGAGAGARIVLIGGLNSDYDIQEELIIMDGQTPVESQNEYIDIFEMTIFQTGTNTDSDTGDSMSDGDIYIARTSAEFTAGVPTNPLVGIKADENNLNSRDGLFTVPDGKILLIKSIFAGSSPDKTQNNNVQVQLCFRLFNDTQNLWYKTPPLEFDGSFQYVPEYNLPIPPKTQVQIRARMPLAKTKNAMVEVNVELLDLR